jgi:DedD protein
MASQDTEITLGTGKMLAFFFGLVALNGAFFGMGYSLGKAGSHASLGATNLTSAPGPAIRPSAMKSGAQSSNSQPDNGNLSFYKAVEQKEPNAQLDQSAAQNPPSASAPPASAAESKPSDAAPDAATVLSTSNYFVQVAAVSKQDDAQALVEALKKKQYTAFATNSSPTDKLYHVQVGPFGDVKDAEATKAKLVSDGYNPILKK